MCPREMLRHGVKQQKEGNRAKGLPKADSDIADPIDQYNLHEAMILLHFFPHKSFSGLPTDLFSSLTTPELVKVCNLRIN